jgi:hypothetical protein
LFREFVAAARARAEGRNPHLIDFESLESARAGTA